MSRFSRFNAPPFRSIRHNRAASPPVPVIRCCSNCQSRMPADVGKWIVSILPATADGDRLAVLCSRECEQQAHAAAREGVRLVG